MSKKYIVYSFEYEQPYKEYNTKKEAIDYAKKAIHAITPLYLGGADNNTFTIFIDVDNGKNVYGVYQISKIYEYGHETIKEVKYND